MIWLHPLHSLCQYKHLHIQLGKTTERTAIPTPTSSTGELIFVTLENSGSLVAFHKPKDYKQVLLTREHICTHTKTRRIKRFGWRHYPMHRRIAEITQRITLCPYFTRTFGPWPGAAEFESCWFCIRNINPNQTPNTNPPSLIRALDIP
jgi:hypothetical protein